MKPKRTIVWIESRIAGTGTVKATYRTVRLGDRTVKKRVIDADSDDFTQQFTSGFRASVRHAREENRRLEDRA